MIPLTNHETHALLAIAERGLEAGVHDWGADELEELRTALEKLVLCTPKYVVAIEDGALAVAA
jgi:hypothetical protein